MGVINNRMKFLAKYGHEGHRVELVKHIDDILAQPQHSLRDHMIVAQQIAQDSGLPLTSEHLHKIIATRNPPDMGMSHPMGMLAKYHFGNMKSEHWDHAIKVGTDSDVCGMMPHMPSEHLAKVAADPSRDSFVRQIAGRQRQHALNREAVVDLPEANE